jgi:hypothetical protein
MPKPSHQQLKSISHKQLRDATLAELRKHTALLEAQAKLMEAQTTLLEVLAKQGDCMWQYVFDSGDTLRTIESAGVMAGVEARWITPATGASASGLPG